MISIAKTTDEIIHRSPFLEEALAMNIINLSALARSIRPQIENSVKKNIKTGAIIQALKRISNNINKKYFNKSVIRPLNMTVRSDLIEYTFANSETLIECQKKLLYGIENDKELFCNITHGMFETTIITSILLSNHIIKIFHNEKLISKFDHLSSVTIKYPEEIVPMPGIYYIILKLLAWKGVNLVELASTYTELTLVFNEKDINYAFSILTDFFRKK